MEILLYSGDPCRYGFPWTIRMETLRESLEKAGHHVTLFCPSAAKEDLCRGATPCAALFAGGKKKHQRVLCALTYSVSSFFKALRMGSFDAVIASSPPPLNILAAPLIAKIKRARFVYEVRDIWPDVAWEMGSFDPKSLYSRIFAAIRDYMLRRADLITAVTVGKTKKLRAYAPEKRVLLVPNGLDEAFVRQPPSADVANRYGMNGRYCCVYIGNVGLAQGLDQLLTLAAAMQDRCPDALFMVFGNGADEQRLRRMAEQTRLTNLRFFDRVAHDEVRSVLCVAQLCYIPLKNERLTDSVPSKLYEALGASCPILLSACGEAVDVLNESGFGMSVKPGDAAALEAAFLQMYAQREAFDEKRGAMTEYAVAHYSRQRDMDEFVRELERTMADSVTE